MTEETNKYNEVPTSVTIVSGIAKTDFSKLDESVALWVDLMALHLHMLHLKFYCFYSEETEGEFVFYKSYLIFEFPQKISRAYIYVRYDYPIDIRLYTLSEQRVTLYERLLNVM